MDRQTDKQTDGITPNFKRNLAMMVIYLPVKIKFDWTKRFFELESGNKNVDGQTNERMKFHQFRKEPSYDGDLSPCQV